VDRYAKAEACNEVVVQVCVEKVEVVTDVHCYGLEQLAVTGIPSTLLYFIT